MPVLWEEGKKLRFRFGSYKKTVLIKTNKLSVFFSGYKLLYDVITCYDKLSKSLILVFYQKWPIESDPNIKGMKDVEG
jgi:hypothetical protein